LSMASKAAKELGLGKFMQIGFVIKNTEKVLEYYEKTLGIGHFDTAVMAAAFDGGKYKMKISVAPLSGIQFELIEPLEGDRIHSDFLKQGREGLHHLGFSVKGLDEKIRELQGKGIKVLERATMLTEDGKKLGIEYAYMDTAHISGVIYELLKF
jgi:methylmalonyl-CoA/ethylmalonyl-CoA epimerase